jgi:serine protease AprX
MTHSIGIVDRMRWMCGLAMAAIVGLFAAVATLHANPLPAASPPAAAPAPAGSSATLDPRIAGLAAHHPSEQLQAIVQFKATVNPARAHADALRAGAQVFASVQFIHGLAVRLTAGQARALAANPDVHSVSLNGQVVSQGDPTLGGPEGWRAAHADQTPVQTTFDQTLGVPALWRAGADGTGVGVAVVDTGIDGQLPAFRAAGGRGSRVIATAVTNPDARTVLDTYGHGTDVAGIIAADSESRRSRQPAPGSYLGVAPDANLAAPPAPARSPG